MKTTIAFTVVAAFTALQLSPADARPVVVTAPPKVVRHVAYADLNLASADGVKILNRRVGSAVNDVCTEANNWNNGSFDFKLGVMTCSSSAWDDARPQIDRAVQRAQQMAATGSSAIAAAAIGISAR